MNLKKKLKDLIYRLKHLQILHISKCNECGHVCECIKHLYIPKLWKGKFVVKDDAICCECGDAGELCNKRFDTWFYATITPDKFNLAMEKFTEIEGKYHRLNEQIEETDFTDFRSILSEKMSEN